MLRPVVAPAAITAIELITRGLSSTNYRVRLHDAPPLQLRVVPAGARTCAKEVAILRLLAGATPVPGVRHAAPDHARPHYVAEWIEATPLDELLQGGAVEDARGLGAAVGETLAGIHQHRFAASGELDADLRVTPFEHGRAADATDDGDGPTPAGSDYARFLHAMIFRSPAHVRLGAERACRLWERVLREDAACDWSAGDHRLVHFDYNPKNLLVRRSGASWEVAAVLDWEFAAAADPLCDVGNLLRHRSSYPAELVNGFIDAYAAAAREWLTPDWIGRARLLDVSSPVESLGSARDRPGPHALALELLDAFIREPSAPR